MAGAHQHTAIHRLQREDVAGLHQITGLGLGGYCGLHGAGAVGGRDASGDALGRFDGGGKGRAFFVGVARHHGGELQALAAFTREGEADQATAKAGHEVDGVGGDVVCRQHQVALVLAVFFVHQNDHAPSAHVGHDVFDG